jgi:hypothetical protein
MDVAHCGNGPLRVPLVIGGTSFVILMCALAILSFARARASEHAFQKDFLVNVAAGFVEIAIGTLLGVLIA